MKNAFLQLIELAKRHPAGRGRIRQEQTIEWLQEGKLQDAASRYAATAEYHGDRGGEHWRLWLEIQKAREIGFDAALQELSGSELWHFTKWAFTSGDTAHAMVAYEQLLASPESWPHTGESTAYLDQLIKQERYDQVLQTVDRIVQKFGEMPVEQARGLFVRYLQKAPDALTGLNALRQRHSDDPFLLADIACFLRGQGDLEEAEEVLRESCRAGLKDDEFITRVRTVFQLTPSQWETFQRSAHADSLEESKELASRHSRGPRLALMPTDEPSPHRFGGSMFRMPNCRGCGHPIRQWFALDLRDIPALSELLPSWRWLPILGCVDCMVWMGRHDYHLDQKAMSVELVDVKLVGIKQFATADDTFGPLEEQFVKLVTADSPGQFRPMVSGSPPWLEAPEPVRCWSCGQDMVYFGVMGNVVDFVAHVPISSENGYQYHFACDACHNLSVIAQWS